MVTPIKFKFFTRWMFGVLVEGKVLFSDKRGVRVEAHHGWGDSYAEWREWVRWGTTVYRTPCVNAEDAPFVVTPAV